MYIYKAIQIIPLILELFYITILLYIVYRYYKSRCAYYTYLTDRTVNI